MKKISDPPSQHTNQFSGIACSAIATAFCVALTVDDVEHDRVAWQKVIDVGGKLHQMWLANPLRKTDDSFCEVYDLVTEVDELKAYLTEIGMSYCFINGPVISNFCPPDNACSAVDPMEITHSSKIDATSFVSLLDALKYYLLPGLMGALVVKRYTWVVMRAEQKPGGAEPVYYLYDSHGQENTVDAGSLWKAPTADELYSWLAVTRLRASMLPRKKDEKEWEYQQRSQYSLTVFTTKVAQPAADNTAAAAEGSSSSSASSVHHSSSSGTRLRGPVFGYTPPSFHKRAGQFGH